ncbi:MAG: hypothetical protein RSD67_04945 [Oscillospiraceae bacterium]
MNNFKKVFSLLCAVLIATTFTVTSYASGGDEIESILNTGKYVDGTTAAQNNTISFKFKDADIRDILSAIALNINYNVIYADNPLRMTVEMKDVLPKVAFDYVLKMAGLAYIEEGSSIVVGKKSALLSDFSKTLCLTKIELEYIDTTNFKQKITELKIPVTAVTMPANKTSVWVQGTTSDVAKVGELYRIFDVPENAVIEDGEVVSNENATGENDTKKVLNSIRLKLISASTFNDFIRTLGYTGGIASGDGDQILWLYATGKEYYEILNIKSKVDKADAHIDMGGLKDSYFTYDFSHITAAEAQRRLATVNFGNEVGLYTSTSDEFSKTLVVYCNSGYQQQVKDMLTSFDSQRMKTVNMPVYKSNTTDDVNQMVEYLRRMLGDLVDFQPTGGGTMQNQFVSESLNGTNILYLINSDAETVKLVENMIQKFDSIKSADVASSNLTWATYLLANNLPPNTLKDQATLAAYALWVQSKI